MMKTMEMAFFGRDIGEQPDISEASKGIGAPKSPFQSLKLDLMNADLFR